ncbi:MAG: hypothetical protein K6G88_10655 [Lachnospiraceae bacterium]|nr:hypothetical protein [Lachnospiraceae bacterium]
MSIIDVITMVLSVTAIVVSLVTFFVTYQWDKKRETVNAYIELQESLHFLYQYDNNEIQNFIDDSSTEEYKALSSVLGRIEIFAIGTMRGRLWGTTYNRKLVYQLSHGYIDKTLREKIDYLLELKSRRGGQEYYKYTRKLLKWMDKESK